MIGFEILRPIVACYIVNYYFSNTTFEQTDMSCLNMTLHDIKQIPCAIILSPMTIAHIKIKILLIIKNSYTSLYSVNMRYVLSMWCINGSYFKDKRNRAAGHRGQETHRGTEPQRIALTISHIVVSCACAATDKK
jgi:hypothetical protein